MRKTLTLLFCAISFCTYSQEKEETPDFEYLQFKRSKFNLIDENGYQIKRKLKRDEMNELLAGYPTALNHYNKFRTFRTLKIASRGLFVATEITGLIVMSGKGDNAINSGTGIVVGGLIFMLGVQLPISIVAGSQGSQAADTYNHHIKKEQDRYSLNFGAAPHGIGLTFNF